MKVLLAICGLSLWLRLGEAADGCIRVRGKLECKQNPDAVLATELTLWDRDGAESWLQWADKDDKMAVGHTNPDGTFDFHGCGNDYNWFGVSNYPEPYLQIYHYCGSEGGREVNYNGKEIFKKWYPPHVKDVGTITLDDL